MQEAQRSNSSCSTCVKKDCSASQRKKDESPEEFEERRKLQSRLCRIRHKIVVLSGKGGVGKSTVAVNIATALMMAGKRVGLLDVDIHGPSIPTMLGLEGRKPDGCKDGMFPIDLDGLKVMSLGFLLESPDDAVIWRGPLKMGVIKQFLRDVVWGDLDYLIIDSPPGTGDEPLSVCQLIGTLDGAVVVTPPPPEGSRRGCPQIHFFLQANAPAGAWRGGKHERLCLSAPSAARSPRFSDRAADAAWPRIWASGFLAPSPWIRTSRKPATTVRRLSANMPHPPRPLSCRKSFSPLLN